MHAPATHETVLLDETLAALAPRPGAFLADVTLGGGGHAQALLEAIGPTGRLLALDRDPHAVAYARERLRPWEDRVAFHVGPFSSLPAVLAGATLDGLVADLGVSSLQLDDPERGLSFRREGPLDMRLGPDARASARELVRQLTERALADLLYTYGEERASRPIARSIKRALDAGALETTRDLAAAVYRVLGPPRPGRIDPATRTFQALRIAVNAELDELAALLAALPAVLRDGGVAAVIAFHSLEDRLVKRAFRDDPDLEALTRKPVAPTEAACAHNPRARSARLRAARRRPREESRDA